MHTTVILDSHVLLTTIFPIERLHTTVILDSHVLLTTIFPMGYFQLWPKASSASPQNLLTLVIISPFPSRSRHFALSPSLPPNSSCRLQSPLAYTLDAFLGLGSAVVISVILDVSLVEFMYFVVIACQVELS